MKCAAEAKAFAFVSGFLPHDGLVQSEKSANNSDRKHTSHVAQYIQLLVQISKSISSQAFAGTAD
ncbi:hypothetical protein J41TS12_36240 [Paenibacillus antibioticophila]|uniref:Uncharacterized protein n=1 Tax=Paenibacillus antibioticophila TaxID=1274374 RepID=A0A919XYB4_9BACL|nr:hypothetical protein J41TS12_36240 [Paenibacillus antibioticophila]